MIMACALSALDRVICLEKLSLGMTSLDAGARNTGACPIPKVLCPATLMATYSAHRGTSDYHNYLMFKDGSLGLKFFFFKET